MSSLLVIDLPKLFYLAGETIKGNVTFQQKETKRIYGLNIHFSGFEFCENSLWNVMPFSKKWVCKGYTSLFGNPVTPPLFFYMFLLILAGRFEKRKIQSLGKALE